MPAITERTAPAEMTLISAARTGEQNRAAHVGDADHGLPAAHHPQPQHAARPRRGQRAQDGPHVDGGLRARRDPHPRAGHVRVGRAGHPVAPGARRRLARAPEVGRGQVRADPSRHEGELVGEPEIEYRRGATTRLVTEGAVSRTVRADAKITVHDVGVPRTVTGRWRAASSSATARCSPTASGSPPCRSCPSSSSPRPTSTQQTKDWFTRPGALLLAVLVLGGTVLVARRLRRGPPRRRTARSEPEAA